MGLDYILSHHWDYQVPQAHKHLVVEPSPYPSLADLGARLRIALILLIIFTLIVINNDPHTVSNMS